VITYRGTLEVPGELVQFVARLLARESALSAKGEVTGLWYSGKAHAQGGNIRAIFAPDGFPLRASPAEPGSVHDITAARARALPALYPAAAGLPALAGPGYDAAGTGIHIAVRQPPGGQDPGINTRARNARQRSLRCPGRTRVRPAHRQPRQDRRHHPRGPRPDPCRARLHHIKPPDHPSEPDAGGKMVTCLAIVRS
jgi:hypothetical protein